MSLKGTDLSWYRLIQEELVFCSSKFVPIEQSPYHTEGPLNENLLLLHLSGPEQEAYHAFTQLYHHYYGILHGYIFPFTGVSEVETREVIQVVFVKLWSKRTTLAGIRQFRAYLFRMARNVVIDRRRSQKRQQLREERVAEKQELHLNTVEAELALKEYQDIARQAIEALPERRRRIFLLRTVADLSLDEIGQELNVSKEVVKKQLYLAVDFIKQQIRDKGDIIFFLLIVPFL